MIYDTTSGIIFGIDRDTINDTIFDTSNGINFDTIHDTKGDTMIYTVGGIKGGSGKTTISTNLAVWLASQGRDVLLLDADDQESASDFVAIRKADGKADLTTVKLLSRAIYDEVPKLKSKFQDIVIDTGGRETDTQRYAVAVSQRLLVPFVPRSVDLWTMQKVETMISEAGPINPTLAAYVFLNRADIQGKDNGEAAEVLKESGQFTFVDHIIRNRKAFANALGAGLGVAEMKPADEKAAQELNDLFTAVTELN